MVLYRSFVDLQHIMKSCQNLKFWHDPSLLYSSCFLVSKGRKREEEGGGVVGLRSARKVPLFLNFLQVLKKKIGEGEAKKA